MGLQQIVSYRSVQIHICIPKQFQQDEIHGSSLESTRGCLRISSNIVNPAARNYVDTRERDLDEVAGIYARNLRLYENHRQGRPNKYGVEIMFR